MKKRIIVITIYDPYPNMGNRLQNYAVQTVLEEKGFEVKSIAFRKPSMNLKLWVKWGIHAITRYKLTHNKEFWKFKPKQYLAFELFNNKYINTCRIHSINDIPMADYFVLGSDQLWNPLWWSDENIEVAKNIYLATFAKPEQIICFSPSFGCTYIPDEWKEWFSKYLKRIPRFTVREDTGKQIIYEMTGKNALVSIDPTLMLSRDEWNKIAKKPKNISIKQKYILTYFLGGRSDKINSEIEKYAKEIDATVHYLFDEQSLEMRAIGPSEFIYLISHATLVLTDSFHACVFSFLYGRPFLVYDREDAPGMMSRMNTLFEKFDLKRKYVNSGLENKILECDYRNGYMILEKERNILNNFLNEELFK